MRYQTISNSLDTATDYFDEMKARRKRAGLAELDAEKDRLIDLAARRG